MNRIRELREAKEWSQEKLGEKIGYSGVAVLHYEKEERRLEAGLVHKLCDLFGCTSDYLLGRSDNPYPQISEEDARHLEIYHGLPPEIRRAVDGLMAPYAPQAAEEKNAG